MTLILELRQQNKMSCIKDISVNEDKAIIKYLELLDVLTDTVQIYLEPDSLHEGSK